MSVREIACIRGEKLFHFYGSNSGADLCANREGFRGLLQQMAFFVISKPGHISALESISRLLGSHLLGAGAASEQD